MNFLKLGSVFTIALAAVSVQAANNAWTYSSATTTPATCVGLDSTGTTTDFQATTVVNKTLSSSIQNTMKLSFVVYDTTRLRTNPTAHADFVYIQRFGQVYYYSDSLKTTTLIGTVANNLSYATEDGLIGVAVDRVFQNRIFLVYSHSNSGCSGTGCTANGNGGGGPDGAFRLSVFPMDPVTHIINIAGEVVVLEAKSFRNRWHTAGALNMDNAGNLYWNIGDNETAFTGPGNTRSLRGGIVRIHPNAGVTSGYTIPSGNLWEVASAAFAAQNRTALAAEYQDTTKIRREIYVKGTRNAYVGQVNPYNGVLTYSQCGPDAQDKQSESWNLVAARFAGWPFWVGTDSVNYTQLGSGQYGKNGSNEPTEGTNNYATAGTWSFYLPGNHTGVHFANTNSVFPNATLSTTSVVNGWDHDTISNEGFGIDTLPPYIVQTNAESHSAGGNCSMGATLWYYDGRVANPNKFPPQMNNVWFNGAYTATRLQATKVELDSTVQYGITGRMLGNIATIFSGYSGVSAAPGVAALVDLQEGPDGALYVVDYGCPGGTTSSSGNVESDNCTGVSRIEFKTTSASVCSDPNLYPTSNKNAVPYTISGTTAIYQAQQGSVGVSNDVYWLSMGPQSFTIGALGPHEIQIMDSQGRIVSSIKGEGQQTYSLPSNLRKNGIYFLRAKSNLGTSVRSFVNL